MMNSFKIILVAILIWAEALIGSDSPIATDSRIKTLIYNPNDVFSLLLNHNYHSYIEFSEGEEVKNIVLGNSISWKISVADNRIFILPLEKNGHTNMIIITNKKRSYIFDLISKSEDDPLAFQANTDYSVSKDLSYAIKFYYPDHDLGQMPSLSKPTRWGAYTLDNIVKNKNSKGYIIESNDHSIDIEPSEIFDDGNLTYLKFPTLIPKIFTVDKNGQESSVKMLLYNGYVVIEGVHKKISLYHREKRIDIINKG